MPEYNLGRAHGKIVIDTDTKGISETDKGLDSFASTVKKLDRVLDKFERVLNKVEGELLQVAAAAKVADKAIDDIDGKFISVGKSIRISNGSLNDFNASMAESVQYARMASNAYAKIISPILKVRKGLLSIDNADSIIDRLRIGNNVLRSFDAYGAAIRATGRHLFHMDQVYAGLSDRQRSFIAGAKKLTAVAVAMGIIAKHGRSMVNAFTGISRVNRTISTFSKYLGKIREAGDSDSHRRLARLARGITRIADSSKGAGNAVRKFSSSIYGAVKSFDSAGRGITRMILGLGIARNSMARLREQYKMLFARPLLVGAFIGGLKLIAPTAELAAKGLVMLSNGFRYVLDAGKQVSGILLALPGAVATFAGAIVPLVAVFGGLADKFKGLAGTEEEFQEMLGKLPEHLKPIAGALRGLVKDFKGMQEVLQGKFFQGLDKEIENFRTNYMPAIQSGFSNVIGGWKAVTSQFADGLFKDKTLADFNLTFMNIGQTIRNMSFAVQPFMSAISDLVVSGTRFFSIWSAGAGGLTQRFADWTAKMRETGQLTQIMFNAREGILDLSHGLQDATKGAWKFITMFSTRRGDNALDSFAESMAKFNEYMDRGNTKLAKFAAAAKSLGTEKWNELVGVVKSLLPSLTTVFNTLKEFGSGLSSGFLAGFLPSIKSTLSVFNALVTAITPLAPLLGLIAAKVIGLKVFALLTGWFTKAGAAITGLVMAGSGLSKVLASGAMLKAAGFFDKLLPKMANGAGRATTAIGKLGGVVSKFAVGLNAAGIALAAGFVGYSMWSKAESQIKNFQKILEENTEAVNEWKEGLRDAFLQDNGLVGKNVVSQVEEGIKNMKSRLDKLGGQDISWTANISDSFKNTWDRQGVEDFAGVLGSMGGMFGGQSAEFNEMQKAKQDADRANEAFSRLGMTDKELGIIITSTNSTFRERVDAIRQSGDGGAEAATQLENLRKEFEDTNSFMEKAGTGAAQLTNALKTIGEAGADSTQKLQGLKAALTALGFDKTTEIDNAIAYANAIKRIGEEAANLRDDTEPLSEILMPDGSFRAGSKNYQNLVAEMKNLTTQAQTQMVEGTMPASQIMSDYEAAAKTLGDTFGITADKVKELGKDLGMVPEIINILVQADTDPVKRSLAQLYLEIQQTAKGQEAVVPISGEVDYQKLQGAIDEAIGAGKAAVGRNGITLSVDNLETGDLDKIAAAAGVEGIQMPGAPKPPNVAKIPVEPEIKPGEVPKQPQAPPVKEAPKQTLPPMFGGGAGAPAPVIPAPKVDTTELEAAKTKIAELEAKITELQNTPAKIEADTTGIDGLKTKIEELKAVVDGFTANQVQLKIEEHGATETKFNIDQLKNSITQMIESVGKISSAFTGAFNAALTAVKTFASSAGALIDNFAQSMFAKGAFAGQQLAAGLQSAEEAVRAAAGKLACAANDNVKGESPTKEGPWSGRGWTYYSGAFAGQSLADGIASAQTAAGKAAGGLAQSVNDYIQGNSPTKKGPLSGKGWTRYSGQKLSRAFAQGISEEQAAVEGSAGGVAGAAGSAMQGPYDIGRLLGVFKDMFDIGKQMFDVFQQVTDNLFSAAKLMADPMGEGKFFGQKLYGRDPSVSDRELARKREDELQSKLQSAASGAAKDIANEQIKTEKAQQKAAEAVAEGKNVKTVTETGEKVTKTPLTPADKKAANAQKDAAIAQAQSNLSKEDVLKSIQTGMDSGEDKWTPQQLEEIRNSSEYSLQTQEQMLDELKTSDPQLGQAIDLLKDGNATNEDVYKSLPLLDRAIEDQTKKDTAASRQTAGALESIRGEAMSSRGIAEQDPIGQAQEVVGQISGLAQQMFQVVEDSFAAISATSDILDTAVRGVENSEDVMKLIDNIQSYITLAANIAGAVAGGLSAASSIASAVNGADPSGGASGAATGLAAASQIASLIQAGLSTVNAVIDLAQEAYRISGKYMGEFLGFLTGGIGGQLMGDVKFLLDENDGTLKTWSADNPDDKRIHGDPFNRGGTVQQAPKVGELNIFPERGADPAELANQMMFAVSAASSGSWSN